MKKIDFFPPKKVIFSKLFLQNVSRYWKATGQLEPLTGLFDLLTALFDPLIGQLHFLTEQLMSFGW